MKTITSKNSQGSRISNGSASVPADRPLAHGENSATAAPVEVLPHPGKSIAPTEAPLDAAQTRPPVTIPPVTVPPAHRYRKWLLSAGAVVGLAAAGCFLAPLVSTALNTVSTEDAYVNGHVTLVAPRVQGQVMKVLVEDNQRVKKGDVLVQLDKEPYQVQLALKRDAVRQAETNLVAAESKARGLAGATRRRALEAAERVRTGRCPGRTFAVPGGRAAESRGDSQPSRGRSQARQGVVANRCHQR